MTWPGLIWKSLLRRPVRTTLTAIGVGLGVGLIVALISITAGVHRTADALIHIGRADFGLFQGDVSDFTRSQLPESLASAVQRDPAVAQVARIKLLVDHGTLVFGLDRNEFPFRRLVVVAGQRGAALAGDHSGKHVGSLVQIGNRSFRIAGIYHSGDRFEDLGLVLPLPVVQALARRPKEITTIGIAVKLGHDVKAVAHHLEQRYPGIVAVTEPGQAVKVDTSSRLIISTGWIVSILALIVGGIGVMNTMAMSVFERIGEIGVLRAVGWSSRRIGAMIVSEALGISLIALAIGFGFGALAANFFVSRSSLSGLIAPSFTASTFAWGFAFAAGVGLIGAIYPTWRAVMLTPVEALRHE